MCKHLPRGFWRIGLEFNLSASSSIFFSEGNPITVASGDSFAACCEAGAEEPKLNCLPEPEPKLGIAVPAPASFLFTTDLKKF
jgi:hypothetical protein